MTQRPGLLHVEMVMGLPVRIDVRDPEVGQTAVAEAVAWLHRVDAVFSTYKADSDISRLNRGELAADDPAADPELAPVLRRCRELREPTGGFFDAWATAAAADGWGGEGDRRDPSVLLPGAVDPSGLVKGWAVERAGRILAAHGARNWSINAGGDIVLRGDALPERGWRVGIQHPQRPDAVAAVIEAAGGLAVATSGLYERGDHVLDPRTGRPPQGVLSVTVCGDDLGTADAYATAALAMGLDGPEWSAALPGYEALTLLADGRELSTPGFPFAPGTGPQPAPRVQLRIQRG